MVLSPACCAKFPPAPNYPQQTDKLQVMIPHCVNQCCVGMRVALCQDPSSNTWVVADADFAYGGVAAKPLLARHMVAAIINKPWDKDALSALLAAVDQDVQISDNAPGGKVEYRRALAASFVFKFYVGVCLALERELGADSAYSPDLPQGERVCKWAACIYDTRMDMAHV